MRAAALALALALNPACAADAPTRAMAPTVIVSVEARALALIDSYAALLETARVIVRNPETPPAVVTALAQAERRATPAIAALEGAVAAYLRAKAQIARSGETAASPDAVAALQRDTLALNTVFAEADAAVAAVAGALAVRSAP